MPMPSTFRSSFQLTDVTSDQQLWVYSVYSARLRYAPGDQVSVWMDHHGAGRQHYRSDKAPWDATARLTVVTGSFILDKVGRRPFMIVGFAGCLICLAIESALVATFASPVPETNPNNAAIRAAVAIL